MDAARITSASVTEREEAAWPEATTTHTSRTVQRGHHEYAQASCSAVDVTAPSARLRHGTSAILTPRVPSPRPLSTRAATGPQQAADGLLRALQTPGGYPLQTPQT